MAFKDIILAVTMAVKKAKAYTDSKTSGLGGGVTYKGSVDYYSNLPASPESGDAYTVMYAGSSGTVADGTEYVWGLNTNTGNMEWIDWSKDSYTKAETDTLLGAKQNAINSNNKLGGDAVDLTGYTAEANPTTWATPAATDTLDDAIKKLDNNTRLNKNNILSIQQTIGDINSVLEEVL